MIQFTVLGIPAPKGSQRAVRNKWTGRAMLIPGGSKVGEGRLKSWDVSVREAARELCGPTGKLFEPRLSWWQRVLHRVKGTR